MRTLKTGLLLTGLTLLLMFGGRALAGPEGMTFGLVLAVAMNGFAYFFSDKIALRSSGAQPVTREQAPKLYAVMERLAAKGNLPRHWRYKPGFRRRRQTPSRPGAIQSTRP